MAQLSYIADSDESGSDAGESPYFKNPNTSVTKPDRESESVLAHRIEESIQDSSRANGHVYEDGNEDANEVEAEEAEEEDDDDEDDEDEEDEDEEDEDEADDPENTIVVMVPGPKNPEEYVPYQDDTISSVLEELTGSDGETLYRVEYEDERQESITCNRLLHLPNGSHALNMFSSRESSESITVDTTSNSGTSMFSRVGKRTRRRPTENNFVDINNVQLSSDDERVIQNGKKKRRLVTNSMSTAEIEKARRSTRTGSRQPSRPIFDDDDEDEDEDDSQSEPLPSNSHRPRRSGRTATRAPAHRKANTLASYMEEDEDELAGDLQVESEGSDIAYAKPKRPRPSNSHSAISTTIKRGPIINILGIGRAQPSRISGRTKTGKSMREVDVDEEMYADEVVGKSTPKVISIREVYQPLSAKSPFALVHDQNCDVCGGTGRNSNKGTSDLIYCQGCSSSIHKLCLGYRAGREHIVTKVGHEHFVMQCRRCIGLAVKKDPLAPHLGACSICKEPGASCAAFSVKKTAKQEEKLREENNGDDPITNVREYLINNPDNVLFRCRGCQRGFHYEHLPPLSRKSTTPQDAQQLRTQRMQEYTINWQCKECSQTTTKLQTLVAWRLPNRESYKEGAVFDDFREDEKEYLVKWDDKSYLQCSWMPGAWVWGIAAASMRKAFIRRDEGANTFPKWTKEEAISEEYVRMEIIFDVEYDRSFRPRSEEHDKAHIDDVVQVLVKFRGLTYDESVWEEPPSPNEAERWVDFVSAYNEYVMGKYFKPSPAIAVKERIEVFRRLNFEKKVVLKKQPDSLIGGEMMQHQMEGLNWLLFKFHQQENCILADEMGLGKTIQVIALIASLVKDKPKCSPFLIVTPNSTCPNWRREIKKWAPSLRVVAFYGARSAREMAMEYEMYPNGCSDLRADIVVTSYEAPVEDSSRTFFKKVKWAGMIVDEGQRLKNDGNLLYGALKALKIPFQVLLSGTPLQNNKRELFNLLQFLDKSVDAAKLDEKYAKLTKENLPELHNLIRPFFLRRTKLQALKFLPPMSQTIIPVSMSVVQKQLYKSILAKNPQLINSIIGKTNKTLRATERSNLNNILMQLRKCLCHPFVYNSAIEETSLSHEALHRNLIDASSKFQLLEIMLPKLQARGHRVLIFSQFLKQLDLVEDFLNGLQLPFQRLDGSVSTLEKQKRIDAFNAPDSNLFAFLLSTRAGGVGINLATADTVIIMDPDFNPHQDIQALSRAHRIGQKKKVLVFQLVTKGSAEEQILQSGRKKMALDQALIESMDVKDDAGDNLEAILRHGAEAILLDDDSRDVRYDPASVDALLDRSQVENSTNDDKTAENQFSHARVWVNDKSDLSDDIGDADTDAESAAPKEKLWDAILKQRAADAALEAAKNMQTFGRGKRARQTVDYEKSQPELAELDDADSPRKNGRRTRKSESDDEFAGHGAKESEAEESDTFEQFDPRELDMDTDMPNVKGTTLTKPRPSSNKAKHKVDVQGSNKSRLKSLTLTLPTPKKSGKQQQGSKKQTDSSMMKGPDSSAIKPTKSGKKHPPMKLIRGEDAKPINDDKSLLDTSTKDAHHTLAHSQSRSAVEKQTLAAFLDKANYQANALNGPQKVATSQLKEGCCIKRLDDSHQKPAVAIKQAFIKFQQWYQASTSWRAQSVQGIFPNIKQLLEWLDGGHNLLKDCQRDLAELEQSDQKQPDIEKQYRLIQERIRGLLDNPESWYFQDGVDTVQQFWQDTTPQVVEAKRREYRNTELWMQDRKNFFRPWDTSDPNYSQQVQEYQRSLERWLSYGDELIRSRNLLKRYCEQKSRKREAPDSQYWLLCNGVRSLRYLCDEEREIREEVIQPRGGRWWGYGLEKQNIQAQSRPDGMSIAQNSRPSATDPSRINNADKIPGIKSLVIDRSISRQEEPHDSINQLQGQQETSGEQKKRKPYKKRKIAEADIAIRDQLVQAGAPFIELLEGYFEWLSNHPLVLPVNNNHLYYHEQLKDYDQQLIERIQKLKEFEDAFDEQFRVQRPRDADRAKHDSAYKKRKIAERKSDAKYISIEDHAPHIQELDRQLRDNMECQLQARLYALQLEIVQQQLGIAQHYQQNGQSEAPKFLQPLPKETPYKILEQHLHQMRLQLSEPRFPPPLPQEAVLNMAMARGGRSGQNTQDPIQLDSDSNVSKPSSPVVVRSTPTIEIPTKRKRGRPSGSTPSHLTSPLILAPTPSKSTPAQPDSSLPLAPTPSRPVPSQLPSSPLVQIPSSSSRPSMHSCPHCKLVRSRLVPTCPCSATTSKIRLMLDNLKSTNHDPDQVAVATNLLKKVLTSRTASQTSSRK